MSKQIFIVKQNIMKNAKAGNTLLPVIRCFDGEKIIEGNSLKLLKDGEVVAEIIYNHKQPLKGGSTVWIETDLDISK